MGLHGPHVQVVMQVQHTLLSPKSAAENYAFAGMRRKNHIGDTVVLVASSRHKPKLSDAVGGERRSVLFGDTKVVFCMWALLGP